MSALHDLVQMPLVQRLGWVLVHSLWQGTAVGFLLVMALGAMRRTSANARYLAACVAIVLFAAAPLMTFLVLKPSVATLLDHPATVAQAQALRTPDAAAPTDVSTQFAAADAQPLS